MKVALLDAYLSAPQHPPLNFTEALTLGMFGEDVRIFHMAGMLTSTGDVQDVWGHGSRMEYPTQATVVSCASNNAQDKIDGTGARKVEILGWDQNWQLATEEIDLDGTTPVTTTTAFWRVILARVTHGGSAGWNEGDVTLTIDGKEAAVMHPTVGRGYATQFTVPPGHTGFVYDWALSASLGSDTFSGGGVRFCVRPNGEAFYSVEEHAIAAGTSVFRAGPLLLAQPETDLTVRAWSTGGSRWVTSSYRVALFPSP